MGGVRKGCVLFGLHFSQSKNAHLLNFYNSFDTKEYNLSECQSLEKLHMGMIVRPHLPPKSIESTVLKQKLFLDSDKYYLSRYSI